MASLLRKAGISLAIKHYFVTPIHSLTVGAKEISRLLIFSLGLVAPGVVAQTAFETPRIIRVVVDNAYAPYSFQSDQGKLQGIVIDQWQTWEKKTGIKVEFHAMDWGEALRRMRAGEFDVIDCIVETAERWDYFDFTPGYASIEASLFFRNYISGITDLSSLKGFPIGVKAGDHHIDKLKANGVTTLIVFQNNDAIIEAAKQRKINVFLIDDPSAFYLLNKAGIEDEFRHSAPVFQDELRRAVRKGDAATLRTVSEGFATIEPGEFKQIDEKWFGRTINRHRRYLTYAGYAAVVALLLIAGLVGWNRTLRKKILQRTAALAESEQRFRQIAENIDEVFWLTTGDSSKTLYISPGYEAVWGRSCESLYQDPRSFISAIHPEDDARVVELLQRNPERDFEVEYRVVRPDGSIRWIRDRAFPIKDESGRFYRIAGIAEDITERKDAEVLLHAKEQEFRAIVENAPDQIIRYDREFRRTYVNPAVAKVYGLPAEALTGKLIGSVIQDAGLDVTDDELAQVRQRIAAIFDTGKSYEYEMTWPMRMGRRYYSVRLFPELDLNGLVVNVLGISRDITERRSVEEELKKEKEILEKIFDNIPVMIGFVGEDGRVKLVNPEWERTIGWTLKELQEQNVDIFVEAYPDLSYRQEVLDFVAASTGELVDLKIRVRDGRVIDAACAVVHLSDGTKVAIAQDITERKQAEEKLRQSETQLAEAQHMAHVGSWNWDLQSNVSTWSVELYSIYGVDPQAFNPGDEDVLREFIHVEDRALVRGAVESSLKTGEPFSFYYRLHRADGEERVIHARGDTVSDEHGNPIRMFGTAQDVTERKQAEVALREAEQKYRDIFENAGEGIFQSTPDGRYIAANSALARMYGFASTEELIHSRQDISRQLYVDPTRREEFKHQLEEQGAVRGFEHEVFRKDGSRLWISVNARVVREEKGEIQYYEGTAQDITDRKRAEEALRESEERYRELFENAKDATYVHDLNGRYTSVNRAAEKLSGYTRAEILGKSFTNFVPPEQIENIRKQLCRKLIEEGETSYESEVITKDGRRVAVEVNSHVIFGNGVAVAVQGTARDITERKAAEEKLKATSEQLRALSARLQSAREEEGTRIAREIHDELGSVLTSLKWDLEGTDKVLAGPMEPSQLAGLREKLHALMKLTDLAISAIRRIASELRPSILDDLGLVAAIEWQAQQFQARTGIVCHCDCLLDKVELTEEQSTAVFRILQEALTNVLRHAQATRVDIKINKENGNFVLSVSDNGKGITESEKSEQQSLGILGMRERAHLIGGEIDIKGVEGKGTVVIVRVPISGQARVMKMTR